MFCADGFRVRKYVCRPSFEVCTNARSTDGVLSAVSRMLVWTDMQSGDACVLSHSVWSQPFSAKALDLVRRHMKWAGGEFNIEQGTVLHKPSKKSDVLLFGIGAK